MLDPHRLTMLRSVIAAGSVHAAAENLGFAPATVSQHIRGLARETGLVLFERNGRGIVATPAARYLAEQGGEALASLERLDRTVVDLREGRTDQVAIACFASVAQAWIPHVAATLRSLSPDVMLEVSLNEPHNGHGRRPPDIDVRNEPLAGPERHLDGYRRHVLAEETFAVVLPIGHPLAGRETIAMGDLADEAWIDHDIYDSPTGQILKQACRAAGFSPRFVARLDDHRAAASLVAAGIGITVLPRLALTGVPAQLPTKPLTNPAVHRRIVAHVRDGAARRQLLDAALAALRESAAE